ncbi:hypothetical protein DY926_14120 [Komagataeibacter melaceti]|uniref:Uncharacterized protein n=1 Tax=Komagataeibacter melaceti TaxID=2766577 RepID=A0A371YXC6_9PROT|nr:hypothetical protein [Komagataeibacter melaceti]RFD18889.1 hypothetical protein DY926_14120 [Komagataeibacter melaceti]
MSDTVTPQSFIGTALASLDAQQRAIPESERGLAKDLEDLQKRLAENPALENDPRFCTQVAWLMQDWQKFSGTGQAPAVSPILAAGMAQLASTYPGLENPQVRAAVEQTGGLHDRQLIADIRSVAMETAGMTPEQQTSFMARMAADHLVQRVQAALGQPAMAHEAAPHPVPPKPAPEVVVEPPQQTRPTPETAPEPAPSSAEPLPPEAGDPGFAPSSTEAAAAQDSVPEPEGRATPQETRDEPTRGDENDVPRNHENQPPSSTQEVEDTPRATDTKTAHETEAAPPSSALNSEKMPDAPQSNRSSPSPEQSQTQPSPAPQNKPQQAPATVPSPVSGVKEWANNFMGKKDERRVNKFVNRTAEAVEAVRDKIGNLRREEPVFFESIEAAARKSGQPVREVIAGMTSDGPYANLRKQYDAIVQRNPNFMAASRELMQAGTNLRTTVRRLETEARERGASDKEPVIEAMRSVGGVGLELEKIPGEYPGKNFLQQVGEMVERLANKFREFFEHTFGQRRERDNSPSMER